MHVMAPGTDEAFDFDMAAAMLQANATDVPMMLRLLVKQLAEVMGKRLTFERAGGRLHRSEEIKCVELTMGDDVLRADVDGPSVRCTVSHSSGGIKIRSEQVSMDVWLNRLLRGLQAEAQHSESARLALQNIVIGGQS
jgi:hypothetical protein